MVCWLLAEQLERDPVFVVGFHYSSGLRLMEALRLRVNDLDLDRRELNARDGKGGKDRLTVLPESLVPALQEHLLAVRELHRSDLAAGWGWVLMPYALARRYPQYQPGVGLAMGLSAAGPLA